MRGAEGVMNEFSPRGFIGIPGCVYVYTHGQRIYL